MISRERIRNWKKTVIELLTVAIGVNKQKETFEELTTTLNDYYNMVVHNPGSYDLSKVLRSTSRSVPNKEDLLSKLEEIPDV